MAGFAVVRDLGAFMQVFTYTVTDVVAHDREAVRLDVCLNGGADVGNTIAHTGKFNAFKEALARDCDQLFRLVAYLSAGDGSGAVTVVAADVGADIHLDDIALADDMRLRRNAVNDLIVDGHTRTARKTAVAKEGRLCACILDGLADDPVDFFGSNTRMNRVSRRLARKRSDSAGDAHPFEFFF